MFQYVMNILYINSVLNIKQMQANHKQSASSFEDTSHEIDHERAIKNIHENQYHSTKRSCSNSKGMFTLVFLVIFLTIFIIIYFYGHQVQQLQIQKKLKSAIQKQSNQIQQVRGDMMQQIQQLQRQLKQEKLLTSKLNLLIERTKISENNQQGYNQINQINAKQNKNINNNQNKNKPQYVAPQKNQLSKIPVRNFKEIPSQDYSSLYCLKQPLIPNSLPPQEPREYLINIRYGFQMYVDGGNGGNGQIQYMSRTMMQQGTFEPDGISLLGRLLRPGYKVLNVGSQSGMEAILSTKIIGPTGHIYIFQPSNFSNYLVNKNFKLNNLTDRADIYKLAASDVKRKANLYIDKTNTGGNSLVKVRKVFDSTISLTQEVQVEIIDNIIRSDVSIDLALIDVQCHEVQALFGMKQLIKNSPYMVILLEWAYLRNTQRNQTKTVEIINFLIEKGYSFYYAVEFDPIACVVGNYRKIMNPINDLLYIDYANLVLSPNTVILP